MRLVHRSCATSPTPSPRHRGRCRRWSSTAVLPLVRHAAHLSLREMRQLPQWQVKGGHGPRRREWGHDSPQPTSSSSPEMEPEQMLAAVCAACCVYACAGCIPLLSRARARPPDYCAGLSRPRWRGMKRETLNINGVTVYVTIRNPKNARTRTKQHLHQ